MIYLSGVPACDDTLLRHALRDFVQQPANQKAPYLQANLAVFQEGYSYQGQKDSTNQDPRDMLHSFVLSEFVAPADFPVQFHTFFANEWQQVQEHVRQSELALINELDIPGLAEFYHANTGHMVSCNYYPPVGDAKDTAINNTRLMRHVDISLFSTFVFGNAPGFSYLDSQSKLVELGEQTQMVTFPGYLLEVITEGKIKALEHQVDLPKDRSQERFSFAYFSIPKPGIAMQFGNVNLSTDEYMKKYYSLYAIDTRASPDTLGQEAHR